jgi:hypothetical protein
MLTFGSSVSESTDMTDLNSSAPELSATPDSAVVKKKGRRGKTQVMQPTMRRFTRSCLNKDGFRPKAMVIESSRPKKKPRAKSG